MDVSRFLSKVLGIYLLIVSATMLINMQQFISYVNALINNTLLMFVTGFFTLIIGILLVVSHNIWEWSWRVIITIFAWIGLIKGVSILMYPAFIDKLTVLFLQNINVAYLAAGIDFLLGVVLCYYGFRRKYK